MKICARCFGATIGHAAAFLLFILSLLPKWYISSIGIGILLIDWSYQEFLGHQSNNLRRLITGVFGGLGVGSIIWTVVNAIIKKIAMRSM
jgi:uncharacterized membrane protein